MLRFGPKLALTGLQAPTLTAPFAKVVDPIVTDPWLRKFLDLECFVLRYVTKHTLRMFFIRQSPLRCEHSVTGTFSLNHIISFLPDNLLTTEKVLAFDQTLV